MTTSAPASRYFTTSWVVWTPVVAASEAFTRPYSVEIQLRGSFASSGFDSSNPETTLSWLRSISGCRKRLNSTRASAPASSRRRAISPKLEK